MHLRNHRGSDKYAGREVGHSHTPLFLAARTGLAEHVRLLREAGAHLFPGELAEAINEAKMEAKTEKMDGDANLNSIWSEAGLEM